MVSFLVFQDDNEKSLEEMFDSRLQEVRKGDKDETLLEHEKVKDFDKRMWEQLHPGRLCISFHFLFIFSVSKRLSSFPYPWDILA